MRLWQARSSDRYTTTITRRRSHKDMNETTILYRPVGQLELNLIRESDYSTFPPRLLGQPIFYPVLSEQYATQIARDWNAVREGTGYVTRFRVRSNYISQHQVQTVGGSNHQEYWILAEELDEFNRNIVGEIEVIGEFRACGETP